MALITGGSRGIGRATASRLLRDGWSVAFTYVHSSDAARELESAPPPGGQVLGFQCDVRSPESNQRLVEDVVARFGSIDALVNNAGIRRDALLYNMEEEQWREVVETNLTGPWSMAKAVIPLMMRQRSGAIVNVASLSAVHGVTGQTNYSAAKGGLVAMTRSLAREVARSGIRVNCVAPGLVETEMVADLSVEARRDMIREVPMRRAVRAEEIAAAIAFLLSEDASAITGQLLCVDGGLSA